MKYKNKEGYPDPTAGKAVSNVSRIPKNIKDILDVHNKGLNLLGFELIGIRDLKTGKEWRR